MPLRKRRALHQFHHQRANALSGVGRTGFNAVDRGDMWVIQRCQDTRLTLEPREPLRIDGKDDGQDLDRHLASELRIPGAIDLAHPPGTQFRDDVVRPEALPDRQAAQAPERVGSFDRRVLEELLRRRCVRQQGFDLLT